MKSKIRDSLLYTILIEPKKLVWHAVARVIQSIVRMDADEDKWPELLGFLRKSLRSTDNRNREVGIYCIYVLWDVLPRNILDTTDSSYVLLEQLLVDRDNLSTRVTTLMVLQKIAETVEQRDKTSIEAFRRIVPTMVDILEQCIQENDEENANHAFQVFDILMTLAAYRVLNALATNISPQQVYTTVMPFVISYMQNPNPCQRRCSVMALSVILEGCVEYVRPSLDEILTLICHGLQDPAIPVRRAACTALSVLAENFPRSIADHYRILLPPILHLMDDPNSNVLKAACTTIDMILKELHGQSIEHFATLIEKLTFLLDHASSCIMDTVINTIGETARQAGRELRPYFDSIWPRLRYYLTLKDSNGTLQFYCPTVATLCVIIETVGLDTLHTSYQDMMDLVIEQTRSQCPSMRKSSYLFLGTAARTLGPNFTPYLPAVVSPLLACCRLEEGETHYQTDDTIEISFKEDINEEEPMTLNFDFSLATEKCIALKTLGKLCTYQPSEFMPYLEQSVNEILRLLHHVIDDVRRTAVAVLFSFLRSCNAMSNTSAFEAGAESHPLDKSPVLLRLTRTIIHAIIPLWRHEEDKATVTQICRGLAGTVENTRAYFVMTDLDEIIRLTGDIFERRLVCLQTCDTDEDSEDDEYSAEYSEEESASLLVGTAAHLVSRMAKSFGPDFSPKFAKLLPLILSYCTEKNCPFERSNATRCISECILGTREVPITHTEFILSMLIRNCDDTSSAVRGEGAFGLGALATYAPVDLSIRYPDIFAALDPIIHGASSSPIEIDYALGAIARLILACPGCVPLDRVLPAFIHALPVKVKYEENEVIFDCLFKLLQSNHPTAFAQLPQLVRVFSEVLSDEQQLSHSTRAYLVELIQALNVQFPELRVN
ncbi:hypothetical protein EC973_005854 [Apophysomyces ossiformis]|uniref:IPO4/5-like TPR repeats domain-containing protein n=1 Tax=Apophysomyces ossiformis TaxID=679940 RepID=A0A8H7BU30_9FUNG|nr:hypothetical protein EC973_005854 [Apophysomyces ossiformis]